MNDLQQKIQLCEDVQAGLYNLKSYVDQDSNDFLEIHLFELKLRKLKDKWDKELEEIEC
jgi:hypothetical protein